MGRGKAVAVESSAATPVSQLLCLSLQEGDRIRVMNLAATSIPAIRACIQASWPSGIQSEGIYGIAYQFKLRGRPWSGQDEEAVLGSRLMAGIFGFLLQAGWQLKLSTDFSKLCSDRDTFYFKQDFASRDPSEQMCAMSFNRSDRIRVIDGPPELVQVVRSCIHSFWHRGLHSEIVYYGVPEFKLWGNPWMTSGTESLQTRMFVGQLIEALERTGWEVYASIEISTGRNPEYDNRDTWILRPKVPTTLVSIGGPADQKPTKLL